MVRMGQVIPGVVRTMVGLLALSGPAVPDLSGAMYGRLEGFPSGVPFVAGESTAPGRSGWMDLGSFQFGAGVGISFGTGSSNREASAPSLSEVTLTKDMDRLSPSLFSALTQGKPFDRMKVEIEVP